MPSLHIKVNLDDPRYKDLNALRDDLSRIAEMAIAAASNLPENCDDGFTYAGTEGRRTSRNGLAFMWKITPQ